MRRRHQEPPLEEQIRNLEERLKIHGALLAALSDPHDLLQILLDSTDPDAAAQALRSRFGISDFGAMAVLDMQFRRVTARDRALATRGQAACNKAACNKEGGDGKLLRSG